MNHEDIIGIDQAKKILDELPRNIRNSIISAAASKALLPVKNEAKADLLTHARGGKTDFSKVRFIARAIKIWRLKSKNHPGAKVGVKGPDIPVGKRNWSAEGYAALLGKGSYKTRKRKGKGFFKGFGNFIEKAGEKNINQVKASFSKNLFTEMEKAAQRTIRRYGYRPR